MISLLTVWAERYILVEKITKKVKQLFSKSLHNTVREEFDLLSVLSVISLYFGSGDFPLGTKISFGGVPKMSLWKKNTAEVQ